MANDKENKENLRTVEISRALAKRRKRFAPSTPHGPANHRRIPLAQALESKLSEVADEISGRTYSEMIADKLVSDALRGKLPALVLSKLVLASDSKHDQQWLNQMFADKTNEELAYFVKHGKWPNEEAST
jgi:hypothetical protein